MHTYLYHQSLKKSEKRNALLEFSKKFAKKMPIQLRLRICGEWQDSFNVKVMFDIAALA